MHLRRPERAVMSRQVPYFAELEAGPLRELGVLVRERKYCTDEVILFAGQRCKGLKALLSGGLPPARLAGYGGAGGEVIARLPEALGRNALTRRPEARPRKGSLARLGQPPLAPG